MKKFNHSQYLTKLSAGVYMRIVFILFLTIACSPKLPKSEIAMTVDELMEIMGRPTKTETSSWSEQTKFFHYSQGIRYQVEGNKVVGKFSIPKKEQAAIQYWRHHLRETPYNIIDSGPYTSKLNCPFKGLDIFFDKATGQVIRLVEYRPIGGKQ